MFPWTLILALDQEVSPRASLSARCLITNLQGAFNYFYATGYAGYSWYQTLNSRERNIHGR
eukprot:10949006-Prorocentrum_lima.AAC.1